MCSPVNAQAELSPPLMDGSQLKNKWKHEYRPVPALSSTACEFALGSTQGDLPNGLKGFPQDTAARSRTHARSSLLLLL